MVEITVSFCNADYDKMIPIVVRAFIKNPIAAKAASIALKSKIKNKTQEERDVVLVNFINEHKSKLLETVNKKAANEDFGVTVNNINANIK